MNKMKVASKIRQLQLLEKKKKRKNQLTQLLRPGLAQIRGEEEEMEV